MSTGTVGYITVVAVFLACIIVYLTFRLASLDEELTEAYYILGYYRVRFGLVSTEDIDNAVGITPEKIRLAEKMLDKE